MQFTIFYINYVYPVAVVVMMLMTILVSILSFKHFHSCLQGKKHKNEIIRHK